MERHGFRFAYFFEQNNEISKQKRDKQTETEQTKANLSIYLFPLKVFPGNTEGDIIHTNRILPPFHARYVRVHPQTWNGRICMRLELYGCESTGQDEGT